MINDLYTPIKGTPHVVKVVKLVREFTKGERMENTAKTQQVLLQRQKFYIFSKETLNEDDLNFEPFSMGLELFLEEYETLTEANIKKPKIKTSIKMRVTPEQSAKVQEMVIGEYRHKNAAYLYISSEGYLAWLKSSQINIFDEWNLVEVDPELFIRTDGTCEEDQLSGAEELKTIKHVLQDMEAPLKDFDLVNPTHYQIGGIETIGYIEAKLTPEEFKGYCKGNSIKYLSRAGHKGEEIDDYKKAAWYLDKLINK